MSRVSSCLLAFALLAAVCPPSSSAVEPGPAVIKVGDPALDGSFIRPMTNRQKITQFVPGGEKKDWGTRTDTLEVVQLGGKSVIRRTQVTVIPKGTITELILVDHKTLAPIATEETLEKSHHLRADFAAGRVTLRREAPPGAEPKQSEIALETPVFDFLGGIYGLLFDACPLAEGYAARLPIVDKDAGKVLWLDFKVTGRELVETPPGRKFDTWVVETQVKGFRVVYYLSREAPYLIKQVNYGPKGGWTTFEMM